MAIDEQLREIICCPKTRQNLQELPASEVEKINQQVSQKTVKYINGTTVDSPLQKALITEDGRLIYRVDDGIPVLLIDKGIATESIPGFNWSTSTL